MRITRLLLVKKGELESINKVINLHKYLILKNIPSRMNPCFYLWVPKSVFPGSFWCQMGQIPLSWRCKPCADRVLGFAKEKIQEQPRVKDKEKFIWEGMTEVWFPLRVREWNPEHPKRWVYMNFLNKFYEKLLIIGSKVWVYL